MNQKERMLAGLPYKAWLDGLTEAREACARRLYEYNHLPPERWGEREALLKALLGKTGEHVHINPPFHCDYGANIEVGENFFANYNFIVLDVGRVKIGKNAQIASSVSIYTAGHPVHPDSRNSGYEYGIDVTIGDNVVIGSGSVVTRDIPDNVIAAGNPCRVIRAITEEDRKYYFKNREFDVDDY